MDSTDLYGGDYYENIDFENLSEEQWAQMPLRRKLLVEIEDKLGVRIPAVRRYGGEAYQESKVYIRNDDLVELLKGVLRLTGQDPRYPLVVLQDED